MRLQFSLIILLTMILSFSFTSSYAAFPAKTQDETTVVKEQSTFRKNLEQTILQYKNTAPKSTDGSSSADAFGLVSLIAGVLGAIVMFIPGIQIISIPLAVAALVFGILGLKGSNSGMAIAGLILGAVEILIILLLILLVAAFLGAL